MTTPARTVRFDAPWAWSIKLVSALVTLMLCVIPIVGLTTGPRDQLIWTLAMVALPLLILLGSLPFAVRGYTVRGRQLQVHRLGWSTTIDLSGLVSAEANPAAMARSLRLFGNGGLFGVTGWFRNRTLGRYRAFVTDPANAVVLRWPARVVVVTPDPPAAFVRAVQPAIGAADHGR
jgi:hypothetical protein